MQAGTPTTTTRNHFVGGTEMVEIWNDDQPPLGTPRVSVFAYRKNGS
jgi:hypothetical protein